MAWSGSLCAGARLTRPRLALNVNRVGLSWAARGCATAARDPRRSEWSRIESSPINVRTHNVEKLEAWRFAKLIAREQLQLYLKAGGDNNHWPFCRLGRGLDQVDGVEQGTSSRIMKDLETLSRKELQKCAKRHGVKV